LRSLRRIFVGAKWARPSISSVALRFCDDESAARAGETAMTQAKRRK